MQSVDRFIELVTGARRGEAVRTIACFMALFLLLTSYYLIKPLRNSYFNREFAPESLPFFFLFIPACSLLVTRIFNFFYTRIPKFRLIFLTYACFIGCKLYFLLTIFNGGKANTLFFYYWTTVYFLLAISILWGSIATIFKSEAAERTFGFISFGGMAGALIGSMGSSWLASSPYRSQTILISAATMAPVLLFLALALRFTPDYVDQPKTQAERAEKHSMWVDFRSLWKQRYVRAIAVMVFGLAFMNTILEFRSQKEVDHQLARQAYQHQFKDVNAWLCKQQPCEAGIASAGFETISQLRKTAKEQRESALAAWIKAKQAPFQAPVLHTAYGKYQDELDGLTQGYLARINFWTNLFGVALLLLAARAMFKYLGLRQVLVQLPICFLAVGVLLFFPLELRVLGIILVVTGTLNYSLNKTAKELLYTQGDDETRFRFKPLIDGPVMRLGDVSAALLTTLCLEILKLGDATTQTIMLLAGMGITLWWLFSSWEVGKDYADKKLTPLGPPDEPSGTQQLATE